MEWKWDKRQFRKLNSKESSWKPIERLIEDKSNGKESADELRTRWAKVEQQAKAIERETSGRERQRGEKRLGSGTVDSSIGADRKSSRIGGGGEMREISLVSSLFQFPLRFHLPLSVVACAWKSLVFVRRSLCQQRVARSPWKIEKPAIAPRDFPLAFFTRTNDQSACVFFSAP